MLYQLSYLALVGAMLATGQGAGRGSPRSSTGGLLGAGAREFAIVTATGKRLYLLRHAKSSWEDPGLDDHERPLAPRGRRTAEVLSKHVRANDIHPMLVLCSSARRTRETLEGVAPGGETMIESELYSAGPGELLARLRDVPEETESVMVIGHNPALQTLVLRLAGNAGGRPGSEVNRDDGSDGSDLATVRRKFPTGALATLSFECKWSELGPGGAELVALVRPKDLH